MPSLLRYQADHPLRPVHWRWERARILREHGNRAPKRGRDDVWVLAALRLQTNLEQAKDDIDRCVVFEKAGPLGIAYDIWDEPDKGREQGPSPGLCRTELEARLLAKQNVKEIAQSLAMPVDAIKAYEAVFFNVSDRLDNPGYISSNVLGMKFLKRMTEADLPLLIKGWAYFTRHPPLIDALLTTFSPDVQGQQITNVQDFLTQDTRWNMSRKAAMSARMLGLNDLSQTQILELMTRIHEAEAALGEDNSNPIVSNIKTMMGSLPISFAQRSKAVTHKAAELRADEQLKEAAGQKVADEAQDFQFPEPGKK